jgi:hypothetical protein
MRRYGKNRGEEFSQGFPLGRDGNVIPDLVLHASKALMFLEAMAGGDASVELVAGELDLLAMVFVLDEPDEVAGREAGIVENLEEAPRGELARLILKPGHFLGIEGFRRRRGILFPAPLEDVGAVEAPDGHAGGLDAMALAEVGAFLPAIARAGRRIIEKKEKFVVKGNGPAAGIFGVLQPVKERVEPRDFFQRGRRRLFAGSGKGIRRERIHQVPILGAGRWNAVALESLKRVDDLKRSAV